MVQVNITRLIDDVQCYQIVRALRWPDRMTCPSCQSTQVIKRGFDDTEPARQRYECHDCNTRFDDLTDTIFAGHHQPLKIWVLCLYFMGLNIPTVSLDVISLVASSCGYYRGHIEPCAAPKFAVPLATQRGCAKRKQHRLLPRAQPVAAPRERHR